MTQTTRDAGSPPAQRPAGDGWDWGHPAGLSAALDTVLEGLARCERLAEVAEIGSAGANPLPGLGVTGIEFAAFTTRHPQGLGSDLVGLCAADGVATRPGAVYQVDGAHYFTQLDICRPLPLPDACVEWVYAEHLIEHVSLTEGIGWLAEVRRILAPGGLLRLTTPDLARYVAGYSGDDGFYAKHRRRMHGIGVGPAMPQRAAFMFNQMFYLWGHRWIYDEAELRYALAEAGFDPAAVRRCAFRDGSRPDISDLDQAVRADETVYVEVTR